MAIKRRDFNRLVLAGAGISPILARSSLAQMSAEELQSTPPKATTPSIIIKNSPRTYNQVNVPRKYTAGRRRFTIYWTWSYPWEANRDITELDNRFSTMTEVRRVGWPHYETPEWSERQFLQGISGTLELFHLSTVRFQNLVGEFTGQPVSSLLKLEISFLGDGHRCWLCPVTSFRRRHKIFAGVVDRRHLGQSGGIALFSS